MNSFEEIKALLREKSGKKLAALSWIVFLFLSAIVFFAVFRLNGNIQLKLMDEYLWEIPKIIESRRDELLMYNRAYETDTLTRAEVGLRLYGEENTLTDAERLEWVRGAVSADSLSLLDAQGELLSTTGPVSPEETFRACIRTLEPRALHLELYPVRSEDGEETGENDGKGFVLLPLSGDAKRSLVFEFSCDGMLELYNALEDWSGVLARMLSRGDAVAFAKTGDRLAGYPLDGFTDDQIARLSEELPKVFQNSGQFRRTENGKAGRLITLLGERYLAAPMHFTQEEQEDTDILLTVPLKKVIENGIYIAVAISAVIGVGIALLQIYVFRRLAWKKSGKDAESVSRKGVFRKTWPGILVVLAVTFLFSSMLLLLESRTNAAITTMAKRESVQQEIDWRQSQERTIRDSFADVYMTRAQMLAAFLTEHPDYETRAGLEELNRIAGTDYLMRVDSTGQERVSSNSYTGFSVGKNLSEAYRAVLMGYPDAVAGPEADPYTGRMQLGAAVLMTDGKGQPDGFLLAVYSADALSGELARMSYENTVSGFAVRQGYIAAAVSDEDGRFIAHTDPAMIGQKAKNYLEGFEPGSSFEGFAAYKGESMCVSASAADGRTLLFMVPERGDFSMQATDVLLALAVLLILALLYYPNAGLLIARAMEEAEEKLQPDAGTGSPIAVFFDGYSSFLTLFALLALIASSNGWWTSFDYVFSGQWSRGVHLYSLWAALFILAVILCCAFLLQTLLRRLESRLSIQARTVTRLAGSLITYATTVFLIFSILSMFGVNTTALLASAGVVSIAVGMGAQSMAADLLAGFFMMLEGTIHVGDHVSAAGVTGYVTDMGIRTTEITDEEGNVVSLNNSKVSPVRNMSRKRAQQGPEDGAKTEHKTAP